MSHPWDGFVLPKFMENGKTFDEAFKRSVPDKNLTHWNNYTTSPTDLRRGNDSFEKLINVLFLL